MDSSLISTKYVKRMFEKLDKNHDGVVTLDELHWILSRLGWNESEHTPEDLELIIGKQSLDLDEFLRFYNDAVSKKEEDKIDDDDDDAIVRAFKVFDVNGDGMISSDEVRMVLEWLGFEEESKVWDCGNMISAYDKNLDGVIDFHEFKNMLLHL